MVKLDDLEPCPVCNGKYWYLRVATDDLSIWRCKRCGSYIIVDRRAGDKRDDQPRPTDKFTRR